MAIAYNIEDEPVELLNEYTEEPCPKCGRAATHRWFEDCSSGSLNSFHQVHCEHCDHHDDGGWHL
jgi:hypothetical protein